MTTYQEPQSYDELKAQLDLIQTNDDIISYIWFKKIGDLEQAELALARYNEFIKKEAEFEEKAAPKVEDNVEDVEDMEEIS